MPFWSFAMKGKLGLEGVSLRLAFAAGLSLSLALHLPWPPTVGQLAGLLALSILAGVAVHMQLKHERLPDAKKAPEERLVWITTFMGVAGVQLVRRALQGGDPDALYLAAAPLAAQGLLIGGLASSALGATTVSLGCLLLGVAGVVAWPVLVVGWLMGVSGAWLVTPLKKRSDLFRAVGLLLVGGAIAAAAANQMSGKALPDVLEAGLWGAVAAVTAASIFWFGAAVLEKIVGLTSDWTLLELCSPDHPLIQDLCMKAPGTYAHSVMVGNLAETAARAVGASPVHCRAMAIFHDVGKLVRPYCFIENQRGANIHDELSPAYSAQLIIAHVRDGLDLARKHGLPDVVVDGISQHHGTSLITPFYRKAVGAGEVAPELEKAFRYPGPKPQSKEAAILHLADSVEAASRLLRGNEDPAPLIAKIVEKSLADGQLAECDLTFRELHDIQESFVSTLRGMKHERIAYADALPAPESHDSEPVRPPAEAHFHPTSGQPGP